MSQNARDLVELLRDCPTSAELPRLALNLIAPGCASERGGL